MVKNAANTGTEALKSGTVGGLLGAAGGISGGAYPGLSSDQNFKRIYKNCMRNRGHNVID